MFEEYYGKKFGRLTVIGLGEPHIYPSGVKFNRLLCVCECGTQKSIRPTYLKDGRTVSCGCYRGSVSHKPNHKLTYDESGKVNKLYSVWHSMKTRCFNKNNENYKYYGGRGISVCDEWRDDYLNFHNWAMANGYADGLQIDRTENDGNYEPSNCQWITSKENHRNTSKNYPITINGETKLLTDWAQEAGISKGALSLRISRGWAEKDWLLPLKHKVMSL